MAIFHEAVLSYLEAACVWFDKLVIMVEDEARSHEIRIKVFFFTVIDDFSVEYLLARSFIFQQIDLIKINELLLQFIYIFIRVILN